MKIKSLNITFRLSVLAIIAILFTACSKDNNERIQPNTPETHHHDQDEEEMPAKVSIELVECHLHGPWEKVQTQGGIHQDPETEAKYLRRVQTITYNYNEQTGWTLADNSQSKFYVVEAHNYELSGEVTPTPVYLMFIKYYNDKDSVINQKFIENGADAQHQHFFTVENATNLLTDAPLTTKNNTTDFIEYKYVDTTPWNETYYSRKATLTGLTNPLGFKGAIKFMQNRVAFNLKVSLLHAHNGKKDAKTGNFSAFNAIPISVLANSDIDISFNIPIVIYANREEYVEELDDITDIETVAENSLSADSNRFIQSIMKAFGLSWTEALKDYKALFETRGNSERGHIWL